jgi:hypothetical protein
MPMPLNTIKLGKLPLLGERSARRRRNSRVRGVIFCKLASRRFGFSYSPHPAMATAMRTSPQGEVL